MSEILLVASGKGGVGKTTITALLCEALAGIGKKVLSVELDSGLRTLDEVFGVGKDVLFDLGDALEGRCSIEEATYSCPFCKGLSLIPASSKRAIFSADCFEKLLLSQRDKYDYIFLDSPAGIGEELLLGAKVATRALIVAIPDPVSIKAAMKASYEVENAGITNQRLIINRIPEKPKKMEPIKSLDEVIDGTALQLIGALWDDSETKLAVMKGQRLSPASKNSEIFKNIARRIMGERISLAIK